jgi:hypothetical protein
MAGRAKDDPGPRTEDVAAYVASMAEELKLMVEPHDLRSLAYLLDLVRLEAEEQAGRKADRFADTSMGNA